MVESDNANAGSAGKRLARGASWIAFATVAEQLAGLISMLILARLLTPLQFGLVGLATSLSGLAVLFSEAALGQALIRQRNLTDGHVTLAFVASLGLSAMTGLVLVLFSELLSIFYSAPALTHMIWLVALMLPLAAIGGISSALLQKRGLFKALSLTSLPGIVIGNILLSIALAFSGFGAWAVLWGIFVQNLLTAGLRILLARPQLTLQWNRGEIRDLAAFSTAQTGIRWINFVARNGDNFVVGRVLGLDALGLYTRAYRLMTVAVEVFSRIIEQVLFPVLSGLQESPERLLRAFDNVLQQIAHRTLFLQIDVTGRQDPQPQSISCPPKG